MIDEDILNQLHYDRFSYESLILQQPQIEFNGLWYDIQLNRTFIVCPSLNDKPKTNSGEDLVEWFDHACRIASCGVKIVDEIKEYFVRIPERKIDEIVSLHGCPILSMNFPYYLDYFLPKGFPKVALYREDGKYLKFISECELSDNEKNEITKIAKNITGIIETEFIVQEKNSLFNKKEFKGKDGFKDQLKLVHSNSLKRDFYNVNKAVLNKVEIDDNFWFENQDKIWGYNSEHLILPDEFSSNNSACLVDATCYSVKNIRIYLSIFQRVILCFPMSEYTDAFFATIGVTKNELIYLASIGRVQFVFPLPFFRYNVKLLSEITEVVPNSVLFSRQLTAFIIQELRLRNPLCFPPFGTQERVDILKHMLALAESMPDFKILIEQCSKNWINLESDIQFYGATSIAKFGMASFLTEIYKKIKGKDLFLEFFSASMAVEWSMGLHASYIPVEVNKFSDASLATVCARAYSGRFDPHNVEYFPEIEYLLKGLLAINNDSNIFDMTSAFNVSVTEQLHEIVKGCYEQGEKNIHENIEAYITELNKKVHQYEKKSERLKKLDILGFVGAIAAAYKMDLEWVPLGIWMVKFLINKVNPNNPLYSWFNELITQSPRDAIFISRLRHDVSQ